MQGLYCKNGTFFLLDFCVNMCKQAAENSKRTDRRDTENDRGGQILRGHLQSDHGNTGYPQTSKHGGADSALQELRRRSADSTAEGREDR